MTTLPLTMRRTETLGIFHTFHPHREEKPDSGFLMARSSDRRKVLVGSLRKDSGSSLLHPSMGEVPEETDEDGSPDASPDYIQQLRSIFGHEKAEYFLNPSPMDFQISSALQKILDEMKDSLSAEGLWRTLREQSHRRLLQAYGEATGPDPANTINILESSAHRPVMKKVSKKRRCLLRIRQMAEFHQNFTALLLAEDPFPDPNNHQGGADLAGDRTRENSAEITQ